MRRPHHVMAVSFKLSPGCEVMAGGVKVTSDKGSPLGTSCAQIAVYGPRLWEDGAMFDYVWYLLWCDLGRRY